MKISNVFNNINIYNKNINSTTKTNKIKTESDNLKVSDKARDFQTVLKAVSSAPDIREDKVNEIMQKFENVSYNVSSEQLAEKLLSKM